jgi:proline racemase
MSMYNEPDWSSLSVAELLEKAQEFAKQAYGKSLSSYAFIERALDRMPIGTKGGEELAELAGKAQQVYQTILELQQSIAHITDALSQ